MSESKIDRIDEDQNTYVICVVAVDRTRFRTKKYMNFYLAVKGNREQAVLMQDHIAKVGFTTDGIRVFNDDIESITLKKKDTE